MKILPSLIVGSLAVDSSLWTPRNCSNQGSEDTLKPSNLLKICVLNQNLLLGRIYETGTIRIKIDHIIDHSYLNPKFCEILSKFWIKFEINHYVGRSLHSNFLPPILTVQPCENSQCYKSLLPRIIWYQSIISGRWFGCDYLKYFTAEFMVSCTPSKCLNNFNGFNLVIICWLGTININKCWEH